MDCVCFAVSVSASLLLTLWGGESILRLTIQVLGCVAELASAGPPETWLTSTAGWRAPLALFFLVAQLAAFSFGGFSKLAVALDDAKMRSSTLPAEVEIVTKTKAAVASTANITLAVVVLLVGMLAEPMVMGVLSSSTELKWFDMAALEEAGGSILECGREVVTKDHDGETNPLNLSMRVHLGLAACFEGSLKTSGEYQVITLAVRLIAMVQSACLIGWWVCSRWGSACV